ncbi:hypothetical protein E0L36_03995 [Streptomyces sp. AJS327]|nr:hypothetical protein [Streptomyces sp. AJS327]
MALSAGAVALAVTLSGCMTVHGETAVVPATSEKEARKVFREFTAKSNRANSRLDTRLNATIEGGALGAINQAALKTRKGAKENGEKIPPIPPLKLRDTRFLIPKQAGWPKFFVADTRGDDTGNRWFYVFQRESVDARWKASYLSVLEPDELPTFPKDSDGHVKAVPSGGGSGLSVAPGALSREYVRTLRDGGDRFADGPHTDKRRTQRERSEKRPGLRTEFADSAARPPQFVPAGLRVKGGGALVFFASHHHTKQTFHKDYAPKIKDPLVREMLSGETPKKAVTYARVSQQAVSVPEADSAGDGVVFLNRIDGMTSAKAD